MFSWIGNFPPALGLNLKRHRKFQGFLRQLLGSCLILAGPLSAEADIFGPITKAKPANPFCALLRGECPPSVNDLLDMVSPEDRAAFEYWLPLLDSPDWSVREQAMEILTNLLQAATEADQLRFMTYLKCSERLSPEFGFRVDSIIGEISGIPTGTPIDPPVSEQTIQFATTLEPGDVVFVYSTYYFQIPTFYGSTCHEAESQAQAAIEEKIIEKLPDSSSDRCELESIWTLPRPLRAGTFFDTSHFFCNCETQSIEIETQFAWVYSSLAKQSVCYARYCAETGGTYEPGCDPTSIGPDDWSKEFGVPGSGRLTGTHSCCRVAPPTPTPTPVLTPDETEEPTPAASPPPTAEPSPEREERSVLVPSPSPTVTPSLVPMPTPYPTLSPTPEPTSDFPSDDPQPSDTPTPSPTMTPMPTAAETPVPTYSYGYCGDGIVDPWEACDEGWINGQGGMCDTYCNHAVVQPSPTYTYSYCGDGVQDPWEACDEGLMNGQGGMCDAYCHHVEPSPTYSYSYCGDGIIDSSEICDEGWMNGLGGICNSNCTFSDPVPQPT